MCSVPAACHTQLCPLDPTSWEASGIASTMRNNGDSAALFIDSSSEDDDESASLLSNGNASPHFSQLRDPKIDGPSAYHEFSAGAAAARPVLGLLGVTVISYFTVSGGPFGLEVAIASGGPGYTLIALLALTLFAALPSALMTAEMSSALPGRGGFSYWVERGIHPTMGQLVNWISLLNTAVDSSAYPGVAWDYYWFGRRRWTAAAIMANGASSERVTAAALANAAAAASTVPPPFWARTLAMCGLVGGTAILNLKGLTLAARAAVIMAVFSFWPFAHMLLVACLTPLSSCASIARVLTASVVSAPDGGGGGGWPASAGGSGTYHQDIPLMLAVCLWSVSGFESVSFVSGEVGHAKQTMPRALMFSLLAMFGATAIPILVSCVEFDSAFERNGGVAGVAGGNGPTAAPWANWALGSFAIPSEFFGGKLMAEWACASGVASSLGLLNAYMATSARNVQAMARKGMLPAVLRGERGVEGTPAPALIFSALSFLIMTPFGFSELVELNMALYSSTLLLEQIALLRLRWIEPELHRPFRIPLEGGWLVLAFLPQMTLCGLIIMFSMRTLPGMVLWVAIIISGLYLPRLMRACGELQAPPGAAPPAGLPGNRWRKG